MIDKQKLGWVGKQILIAIAVILFGSILMEMFIYTTANKLTEAYTSGFTQSFK